MRTALLFLCCIALAACGPTSAGVGDGDLSTPVEGDLASSALRDLSGARDLQQSPGDLAMQCLPLRQVCGDKSECCDAKADCQLSPSDSDCCLPRNVACTDSNDCCGLMACTGAVCACTPLGMACAYTGECCSGTCAGGTCSL